MKNAMGARKRCVASIDGAYGRARAMALVAGGSGSAVPCRRFARVRHHLAALRAWALPPAVGTVLALREGLLFLGLLPGTELGSGWSAKVLAFGDPPLARLLKVIH